MGRKNEKTAPIIIRMEKKEKTECKIDTLTKKRADDEKRQKYVLLSNIIVLIF